MSLRSITVYLEPRTLKRLRLCLRLYPQKSKVPRGEFALEAKDKTTDELADQLINEGIEEKFPLVLGLEKVLVKAEKDFIASPK